MLEAAIPLSEADIQPALQLWSGLEGSQAHLINHSENQTFAVTAQSGERYSLRVHRPAYQSRHAIESELAWLAAIRRDTDLPVPELLVGRDGSALQRFVTPGGETQLAALFRFIPGSEPTLEGEPAGLFTILGQYAATLHGHVTRWSRPSAFERPTWDGSTILRADGLWGDWRIAPGVDRHNAPIFQRLEQAIYTHLADYGTGAERFGLIHADMRLGNLLVDADRVTLIDFDDCGFGWFTYDFAAAISFHEASPVIPALKAAWLDGYGSVRALNATDIASMDTMVMLRRMALLAWIGSHAETRLAQTHMGGFADDTAKLAERYLGGALWP